METRRDEFAFTFGGGGARGAYQVGFLRHVARRFPALAIPILTGVSAGAINAAFLANHTGPFAQKVDDLARLWHDLTVERVFRADTRGLLRNLLRVAMQLTVGAGRHAPPRARGLVETDPLRELLREAYHAADGRLVGIARNLADGGLRAVALTTTSYSTGQTITFCEGRTIEAWERPMRRSVLTSLGVEHVMASAALPLFFPAVRIGNDWHGDGGVRLHSPLAPATHLGAARIVAVSTNHVPTLAEADQPQVHGYPPPAQILGVLYDAVFLDFLDQDAAHLERVNRLLATAPRPAAEGLRHVDLLVVRPTCDLAVIANDYEPRLPPAFRFLTRRLGTRQMRTQEMLSVLMFQPDYLSRLIELGERDADARADEIAAFLGG